MILFAVTLDTVLFGAFAGAITALSGAIVVLWQQTLDLQRSKMECREQHAATKVEVMHLQGEVERLREFNPGGAVFVTATLPEATITHVTDECRSMFGWTSQELMGQSIDMLIPDEFRERHHDGIRIAMERGSVRPGSISVAAYAQHKSGARVPVVVSLAEQPHHTEGKLVVVAQINHRRT